MRAIVKSPKCSITLDDGQKHTRKHDLQQLLQSITEYPNTSQNKNGGELNKYRRTNQRKSSTQTDRQTDSFHAHALLRSARVGASMILVNVSRWRGRRPKKFIRPSHKIEEVLQSRP